MASRIITDTKLVWAYVAGRLAVPASTNMKGIGLERDGELIAGVLYEGFNHHNVWMHVAAQPGGRWMTKSYLRYCFEYPFNELGVDRISGYVEAHNDAARRFDEHLGFKQEAILSGAASNGGDVIVYVMRREDCRYLEV